MKFVLRALSVVTLCLVALTGCSANTIGFPEPTETPAVQYPATGGSLASEGFTCPVASDIWLPPGTVLTYTADQPNLVIAVGKPNQADTVEAYLRENLPALGWEITGQGDGGLTFKRGEWHGGYALGQGEWALTVRND